MDAADGSVLAVHVRREGGPIRRRLVRGDPCANLIASGGGACYVCVVSTAIPHQFSIGIDPADIDFMGHVNNASYLKWVQDAVVNHWQRFAPAEAVATTLWVALKHEITYRKPTFLDDEVIATVLLQKVQGARAFYQTIIRRGEEVLAEVQSSWCCIDATTLRPARIATSVAERFFRKE